MLIELYIRRRDSLLRRLIQIVHDRQTAEDLVQEAYMRAGQAITRMPSSGRSRAISRSITSDARTGARRLKPSFWSGGETATASAESQLIEREQVDAFRAALEQLPDRARRSWQLCYSENKTYAEAAGSVSV